MSGHIRPTQTLGCLWLSLVVEQVVQGWSNNPTNMDLMQPCCVTPLPTHVSTQSSIVDISPIRKQHGHNYPCPVQDCLSSFRRRQDRNRHVLAHLPYWIHCPYPGCSWRGDRPSVFNAHWSRNHPSSGQDPGEDQYKTYDPLLLVGDIVEGTLSIQEAQNRALSMVEKKASELGMKELCENIWGRRGRRPQRLW